MSIQLFVPTFRVEECLEQVRECLEKGWTGLGFKTQQIEEEWKKYTGLPHAHFLASNTVGLHLAFHMFKSELGWQDDDEVITTPLTFVSSNHAILYENLKPVFADVDQHLCLDPVDVEKKITSKTKAIIFVGLGGNVGQYNKIREICDRHNLKLILDAAHMSGTRYNGKHVGYDADVTIFSFQAVKNMPTADSGMICFKNEEDDARARKLCWLGINKDTFARTTTQGAYKWMYDVEEVGFKYHGNSIMAGLALVSLKYLDRDNAYRRQLAQWYEELFVENDKIKTIPMAEGCESSRHLFQIRISNRDEVMLALHEHDVYPGVHYRDNTAYRMYAHGAGMCPESHKASDEILSLPMHMGVSRQDVEFVAELINKYVK
ncbi:MULTISPECIES: DegT/DnrJ/EryC1/StrS family aminotransferase [Aeromonas]|uniref:DegT/DnrJ/EryC1/StrS family aminotransferase n=1 Tax=Aeromonas TaxID=642 RepID=UPI00191CF76D|nr:MULTISPECIES: DegT/DnrJ/EryC1/StrS family aminotransferase [Aeromonas]MBL0602041.1 DegT/DnrJ/EryC1/StrS family aminotransferase [Aeromonas dhakensis]MCV3294907.1 DegT/DnrJ/EryC1/StrS family aminotransferase [Aeromonas hydrophila]WAF92014.1 DegT/DnrJ/EryC1/StrS family aminotransferase [Aeromonas hydrophila]WAG04740.1 DegT/DnrJ/EryC1/StrS family aminotransferase [Aeromonas hydrophila]HEA3083620.1 DegT/DnrJ/EryC1/StrS family aminotransferase [Aeromonas dhakensis]